jgi:hypothetical protein
MLKLNAILTMGLVASTSLMSTIVPLEIIGLTNFFAVSSPFSQSSPVAWANGKKRPYRRASGGKRTPVAVCKRTTAKQTVGELIAFLPESKGVDQTSSDAPTLYFYIPNQTNDIASLKFRLEDKQDKTHGQDLLNPPLKIATDNTPGVVKVALPKVLLAGKAYQWSLTMSCKESDEPAVSFKGMIVYQPLTKTVSDKIAQAPSEQAKAAIYKEAGYDLDAMAIVMETIGPSAQSFEALIDQAGFEKPN